jgi:hypothetical protein
MKFEDTCYHVSDHCDGNVLEDEFLNYHKAYLRFGPLKETKEKNVAKFFIEEEFNEDPIDMLNTFTPHGATKQFVGILKLLNDNATNACPVSIEGLVMHWYFESEINFDKDGNKYYTVFINCANGDPDNSSVFNPYLYESEYKLILQHVYDAICKLGSNPRFNKMY